MICPTGGTGEFLSIHAPKNNSVFQNLNLVYVLRCPASSRGAYRDRHETWSAGCGGREGAERRSALDADGEAVWFWYPLAGAKFAMMLSAIARATVTKTSRTPGSTE